MGYSKAQLEIIERRLNAMRTEYLDTKVAELKSRSASFNVHGLPMEWMPDTFFDPRYHRVTYYGVPAKAIKAGLAWVDTTSIEVHIANECESNGFSSISMSKFVKLVGSNVLLEEALNDARSGYIQMLATLEARTKRKVEHYIESLVLGEKANDLPNDPAAFFDQP